MASFVFLLVLGLSIAVGAAVLAFGLLPGLDRGLYFRTSARWALKGIGMPAAIWALMNLGLSLSLQAFMPRIQAAQAAGGGWGPAYWSVLGSGVFVICSYWAAVTLGWTIYSGWRGLDADSKVAFKGLALTCLLGLSLPAGLFLLIGGWALAGLAATVILAPLAGYAPRVLNPPRKPPMYARAIARIKFGKYAEAEWEIIRELEKCEQDYEGWLMLAELYATRFNDLEEAERTILELCDQPQVTPSNYSVAMHRLADWQLSLGRNPAAALRALQRIGKKYPGSHLARMAQLRINQLPHTVGELQEQESSPPIPLPALGDSLDEAPPTAESEAGRQAAALQANECVERLKLDPNNIAARERLARLLAEHLGQTQMGLDQLGLLIALPDQPPARQAEWLSLSAAWQIKYLGNLPAGIEVLERLVRECPQTSQAFAARHRLEKLRTTGRL